MTIESPMLPSRLESKWLPYLEYKDSGVPWLGRIPRHWGQKRLKRIFQVFNGATPRSTQDSYWNGDIPWVTPEDLGLLNGRTIETTARQITQAGHESCGTHLVPAGSLVLSTRAPIGHLSIAGVALCTNQGCRSLVLTPKGDIRYFFYELLAGREELRSWGQGSTFMELASGKLGAVQIAQPPLEEQQAVAGFLNRETAKIDALIAKRERLIELLGEKRAALISRAVTKGLDPSVPMRDPGVEWLGKIPAHWEVSKLGAKCSVKARLGWKGLKASEYVDGGFIFLATPNIKGKQIDFVNVDFITRMRFFESPEIILRVGDVLVAKDGNTLGITNVVRYLPAPATVNGSIAVVRPKKDVDCVFLYYWLSSGYCQNIIQRMKGGMGVPHLFQADFRKFFVLVPPISEQQAIAAFLDERVDCLDRLIAKSQDSIERLKEYRGALISYAVSGDIDVRGEVP